MKELARLLSYARRYWLHVAGSVVLMALAGAAQGMMALLIKPIFDRVLNPGADGGPIALPILHKQLFLPEFRTPWTTVGIAIVIVFLVKGVCDYLGNYLISWANFLRLPQKARNDEIEMKRLGGVKEGQCDHLFPHKA